MAEAPYQLFIRRVVLLYTERGPEAVVTGEG